MSPRNESSCGGVVILTLNYKEDKINPSIIKNSYIAVEGSVFHGEFFTCRRDGDPLFCLQEFQGVLRQPSIQREFGGTNEGGQ